MALHTTGVGPEADGYVNPMEDPSAANAAVAAVLGGGSTTELPTIKPPADDTVRLPGGLVTRKFPEPPVLLATEAQVRELTGRDEEAIYKALRNPYRLMNTILTCGTEMLGEHHPNSTLLKDLLIGDRDAIILAIRRATYGDEIEYVGVPCMNCGETVDLTVTLDDIPTKTLADPLTDREFDVALRRGGKALVRLPNGHDQEYVGNLENVNDAEVNSAMLQRCVIKITNPQGQEIIASGNPAVVMDMGLSDRKAILSAITERQPGPRYDEVKFTHDACGKESPVLVTVRDLFREL